LIAADWSGFNFAKFDALTPGVYNLTFTPTWLLTDTPDYTVRVYANTTVNITAKYKGKNIKGTSNPIISNFSERVNGTYGPDAYYNGMPDT
jgi:hypothetical protein